MLRRWLRAYGSPLGIRGYGGSDPVTGAVVAERLAMLEMRKRLRDVEEEHDILNKLWVSFLVVCDAIRLDSSDARPVSSGTVMFGPGGLAQRLLQALRPYCFCASL